MELADCTHRSNLLTLPFVCQVHCKSFFFEFYDISFINHARLFLFLFILLYQGKKNRKLFWVPAIAPLLSVIISTFFVYITHAEKDGVQIVCSIYHWSRFTLLSRAHAHTHTHINNSFLLKVRHITKGVNPSSIDQIYFTGDYLVKGFKIGVVAGMIALTVCKKFSPQSIFH